MLYFKILFFFFKSEENLGLGWGIGRGVVTGSLGILHRDGLMQQQWCKG